MCRIHSTAAWSELFLAQDSRVLLRNLILRESDFKAVTRLHLSLPLSLTYLGDAGGVADDERRARVALRLE